MYLGNIVVLVELDDSLLKELGLQLRLVLQLYTQLLDKGQKNRLGQGASLLSEYLCCIDEFAG